MLLLQFVVCALLVVAAVYLVVAAKRWPFAVAAVVQVMMAIIALIGLGGGWWLGLLPVGTLLPSLGLAFAYSRESSAYLRWAKGE